MEGHDHFLAEHGKTRVVLGWGERQGPAGPLPLNTSARFLQPGSLPSLSGPSPTASACAASTSSGPPRRGCPAGPPSPPCPASGSAAFRPCSRSWTCPFSSLLLLE